MKVGDIVQFKYGGLYMTAVQLHNILFHKKIGATHTAHIYKIEDDVVYLAEAMGTRPYSIYSYDKSYLLEQEEKGKLWFLRSLKKVKDIEKNTDKYLGRKYDWLAIWGIFFKSVFKKKSILTNAFKGDKFLICSEGTLRVLYDSSNKKIDLNKEFNLDTDLIAPMCLDESKYFRRINGKE